MVVDVKGPKATEVEGNAAERARDRAAELGKRVRPFLVAVSSSGDDSVHLVTGHHEALCGDRVLGFTYDWLGWADDDGEMLVENACRQCHGRLKAMGSSAFQKLYAKMIGLSRDHGVRLPPEEVLGFKVTYRELTPDEIKRAEKALKEFAKEHPEALPEKLGGLEGRLTPLAHFLNVAHCRETENNKHDGNPCSACGQRLLCGKTAADSGGPCQLTWGHEGECSHVAEEAKHAG